MKWNFPTKFQSKTGKQQLFLQFSLNKQNTWSMFRFNRTEIFFIFFNNFAFLIPSLHAKKRRSIVSNFQEQQFIAVYTDIRIKKKSIDPCPSIFVLSFIDSSLNSIGAVDTTYVSNGAFVVYVVYCQTFPPKHVPCM